MENPRCCINHKDLKTSRHIQYTFINMIIKRQTLLAPAWAIIRPQQYKKLNIYVCMSVYVCVCVCVYIYICKLKIIKREISPFTLRYIKIICQESKVKQYKRLVVEHKSS
jgi:hypothetical protein